MPSIASCFLKMAIRIQLSQRYIWASKVTMTTILSRRKTGPWKRDDEKKKETCSILSNCITKFIERVKRNSLTKLAKPTNFTKFPIVRLSIHKIYGVLLKGSHGNLQKLWILEKLTKTEKFTWMNFPTIPRNLWHLFKGLQGRPVEIYEDKITNFTKFTKTSKTRYLFI